LCAEPYEGITRNLAQTIAGKNRGDHLRRRHWLRFIRSVGVAQAPRSGGSRLQQRPFIEAARADVEAVSRRCRPGATHVYR